MQILHNEWYELKTCEWEKKLSKLLELALDKLKDSQFWDSGCPHFLCFLFLLCAMKEDLDNELC
jgi:hypothetical protein